MSSPDFDPLLASAHRHASAFLGDLPARFVGARAGRDDMMAAFDAPLAEHGEDAGKVIDLLAREAARGASACASPRYFGFVIGGSLPVALATDWLVSTWDQNAGIHVISPMTAAMEEVAARWLLELFDLPRESGVGFVTGCQMAHFTCLAAARHGVLHNAGHDVEADGLVGAPRIHVVASAEAHVTLDVALRYLGIGTRALVRVDADEQGRMRADRLREVLAALEGPAIVCAQAGNVNTGAFDPLVEIAEAARRHGAW
ncbi:MAG TPA: pyridoxal-dependent decarboxylase, partial [Dokdonella sp.]